MIIRSILRVGTPFSTMIETVYGQLRMDASITEAYALEASDKLAKIGAKLEKR